MNEDKIKKIYQLEKNSYYDIVKKLEESGEVNFKQCAMRLRMLYFLKNGASKLNLVDDLKSYELEEKNIKDTLEKFGYKINN